MTEHSGDRRGVGGPKTEEGKARALANLVQNRKPGSTKEQHGAHSVRLGDPIVQKKREEITALLEGDLGALLKPADQTTVWLLAANLRQQELLIKHLEKQGPITKAGTVRPALEMLVKLQRVALDYCNALGMTPASRNRMGLKATQGTDLAALFASGVEIEEVEGDDVAGGVHDDGSGEGLS